MTVRVVLAEDHALVRNGIAMILGAEPGIEVVGEAGNGAEAVALVRSARPDVLVTDLRMPGADGVDVLRALYPGGRQGAPDDGPKVLILTGFRDDTAILACLRAGARGLVLKHAVPQDLVTAIRRVAAGDAWIDPMVAGQVITALGHPPGPGPAHPALRPPDPGGLTPRERQVLALMARGLSNSEIRDELVISEATVKTHVARVVMKTGARDRAQAVAWALGGGPTGRAAAAG